MAFLACFVPCNRPSRRRYPARLRYLARHASSRPQQSLPFPPTASRLLCPFAPPLFGTGKYRRRFLTPLVVFGRYNKKSFKSEEAMRADRLLSILLLLESG